MKKYADAVPKIQDRLHPKQLNLRLRVCQSPTALGAQGSPGGPPVTTKAGTMTLLHSDGTFDCMITVFPLFRERAAAEQEATRVHELMHCFISWLAGPAVGTLGGGFILPPWVNEGIAEWAAGDVTGGGMVWWGDYLSHIRRPLVRRTYDAFGFFAHLQHVRRDMWQTIPGIVAASIVQGVPSSKSAFRAATANDHDRVLDALPSGWLREGGRGASINGVGPWDQTGIGITGDAAIVTLVTVENDGPGVRIASEPWASDLTAADLKADVVTVAPADGGQPYGRFGPGAKGDYTLADAMTKTFCTRSGGCTCKDGKPPPVPATPIEPGRAFVALTGGRDGAAVVLSGTSADTLCAKPGRTGQLALPDPCKLVTQAEAAQAAGEPVNPGVAHATGKSDGSLVGEELGCTFGNTALRHGAVTASVAIRAYDLGDAAAATFPTIAAKLASAGTGKVPSLGDDNFYICATPGCATLLYVRRANIVLQFSVLTADGLEQATRLATLALTRM